MEKVININNFKKAKEGKKIINEVLDENLISTQTEVPEDDFSYNLKVNYIYEYGNCYCVSTQNGRIALSNFIIENIEAIECNGNSICNLKIVTNKKKVIYKTIKMSDLSSASNFKKALLKDSLELFIRIKNDMFDDLRIILMEKGLINKKGISHTGVVLRDSEYVFVGNDRVVDKDGNKVNDLVCVSNTRIKTGLLSRQVISDTDLISISDKLFNFNDIRTTASVIGFCASCFLRERAYLEIGAKGPQLIIVGEAGCGKSEITENIIMSLFDITASTSADQCTRFTNVALAGSSNTLPFIINEFKPTRLNRTKRDEISALLRNSYDRTPGFRGNGSQELKEYPVLTPIILVGEMAIEESAILERSLIVYSSKSKIRDKEREQKYNYLKTNKVMLKNLGRGLVEEALKLDTAVLLNWYKELASKLVDLPSRVKNSVINCMLGILLINNMYDSKGLDFQKCTGYSIDDLLNAVKENVIDTVLEGKKEVMGILEQNLEILNDMAEIGELTKGVDYQVINSGTELALNIKLFYHKLLSHMTKHNIKDVDALSQKEFVKQLKLKEYYKDYKVIRFVDNLQVKNARAFVIDITKLSKDINVENLCS